MENRDAEQELLRLPFDLYQRYGVVRAVASSLRARVGRPLSVLDVGGLGFSGDGKQSLLPIRLCLPNDRCITLDTQESDLEGYVRGAGELLPFGNERFDLVVTCDTLEHVHPERREAFVDELLRVSADCVVLIAPRASRLSELAERILDHYITHSLGVEHRALREHLVFGLPESDSMINLFHRRNVDFVDFESGYIYSWLTVQLARHYLLSVPNSSQMIAMFDEFYNLALSRADDRGPGYRHVFVMSKQGRRDVLREIGARFAGDGVGDHVGGAELFQLGMMLLNMRRTEGADEELWKVIAQKEAHIAQLQALVGERNQAISDLRVALGNYSQSLETVSAALEKANLEKSLTWRVYSAVSGALVRTQGAVRSRRSG